MGKYERFYNFIERIFESSHLQIAAGAIQKAYREEIFLNAEEIHQYIKKMKKLWETWKSKSKIDFISRFVEELGSIVFISWLSEIFAFNAKQIRTACLRGPSSVDSLLEILYLFDKDELKIIKELINKHKIDGQEDKVARTLFIEAIKAISESFSRVIEQPYKIFTSEVDILKKRGTLEIKYKGAGRVIE